MTRLNNYLRKKLFEYLICYILYWITNKLKRICFFYHLCFSYYVPGERDSSRCNSFGMAMEGYCGKQASDDLWMHNKVHNMIQGSMCCVGTSANDPLFMLHHTQVDRMFSVRTSYKICFTLIVLTELSVPLTR